MKWWNNIRNEKKIMAGVILAIVLSSCLVYQQVDMYMKQNRGAGTLSWEIPLAKGFQKHDWLMREQNKELVKEGLHFFSEEATETYYGRLWGVKDAKGKTVIPATYETIMVDQKNGYLRCTSSTPDYQMTDRYCRMDGTDLIKGAWKSASMFEEGYAVVSDGTDYQIMDMNGQSILRMDCDSLICFDAAKGWYQFRPTQEIGELRQDMGLIDRQGNVVLEPVYTAISEPSAGKILVEYEDADSEMDLTCSLLDGDTLEPVFTQEVMQWSSFSDEGLVINLKDGIWQSVDLKGTVIGQVQCEELYPYHDGIAVAKTRKNLIAVDRSGKILFEIPHKKKMMGFPGAGFSGNTDDLWWMIQMRQFSEGLLVFRGEGSKYGYMDAEGSIVIEPIFDYADSFEGGRAYVEMRGKGGILKKPLKNSKI